MAKEDAWKSLGEFIRAQRRLADLSLRQLSQIAKVSNPYLSQVERGIHKPSAEVLKSIADGLQISAESLFNKVGLLDSSASSNAPDVERAIKLDGRLSSEQKSALIKVYRSFVGAPKARRSASA
jgi:transcriptional regulator with XRE-family HTH domain